MRQKTVRKKKAGRFLTLVLAGAMTLSMSGTAAFAAPNEDIVVQGEGGEGDPTGEDIYNESLAQIVEDLDALVADVEEYIDTLIPELSDLISEKIAEAKEVIADATEKAEQLVAEAKEKGEQFIADAKEKAQQLITAAKEKAQQLIATAKEKGGQYVADAKEKAQQIIAAAKEKGEQFLTAAKEKYETLIAAAKEKGEEFVTAVKAKGEELLAKANETVEQLKQLLAEAKEKGEQFIAEAKAAAAEKYAKAKEAAEKIIADAKDKAPEIIEQAKETAAKVLAEAKEEGEALLTAAKEKAAKLIADVKEKAPEAIETVKETIQQLLEEARKLITLKDPTVELPPAGKDLTANKKAQALVTEGECTGGTYYYALGDDDMIAPEFDGDEDIEDAKWSTEVPTAKAKGTYYVWYMIVGDLFYNDTEPECVISTISQWKKYSKGWKYELADGTCPKNEWMEIEGTWYFFDKDGYMEENAYREGYYLKKSGAWDGGKKKAGWKHNSTGWWYCLPDGSWLAKVWMKIDGKWYYFKADGYMAESEYVDGYYLGRDGAWDGIPKASWKQDSKGWYYIDTKGWYPKNRTLVIDGKSYNFDAKGYCLNP